jgi:hypothetical protein
LTSAVIGTRLGWEGGFAAETEFRRSQEDAKKRGAYPKSGARIVSPLVNGCAITIFFSFSAVAKSLSKTSTAIMVDVPMKPNSNPLVSIKSYFL